MKLDTTKVTLENVDAQFCSDWLKGELRRLLNNEIALKVALQTLRVIAAIHKPPHSEASYWGKCGLDYAAETCAEDTRQAREALTEIGKILGEK